VTAFVVADPGRIWVLAVAAIAAVAAFAWFGRGAS
jgi:hypothetical protein